ncbi:MAG: SH3 domain-containing protein [Planctomycetota bacterium]
MQSRINIFIIVCLVCLTSVGFAQEATLAFPYVAQITGDDVYIRSGPGTNYYRCGKLNKIDKVVVVSSKLSWSQIVPPQGSFSLISKDYVSVDPNNPTVGIVTGDNVRVYAGSEEVKSIHSEKVQRKLNKGENVKIITRDEETGDYYKISPPTGAYLWVSTRYTKPLGPVSKVPLIVEPEPKTRPEPKTTPEPATATKAVAVDISVQDAGLKEYQALKKQIEAERAKPMARQNYANIKKSLTVLSKNKEAGKAARYAEFAIEQIKGIELALAVTKELKLQDEQLQRVQKRIDEARAAKQAKAPDLGRFAVVGKLQISSIYTSAATSKHYRVLDESGKTLCYALPSGPVLKADLSKFIGRKIGLLGTIQPHPQTSSALVQFTEIILLK